MSDFEEATTTELLALPVCKRIVATYAGMADLSAFSTKPEKLANLVSAMETATSVPPALSDYSLDQVHHAAEMVRWCVLKDTTPYEHELLAEMMGFDWDYDQDEGSGD